MLASLVWFASEIKVVYDATIPPRNSTFIKEDKPSKAADYDPRQ